MILLVVVHGVSIPFTNQPTTWTGVTALFLTQRHKSVNLVTTTHSSYSKDVMWTNKILKLDAHIYLFYFKVNIPIHL